MNKKKLEADPALKELLTDGIKDIFWAENHLIKTLPKMIEAASSTQLAEAIGNHLKETEGQVARLKQVFELLGEQALAQKCDAMEGLAKEGESIVESTEAGTTARDVGIIMASQKVEHYEIASYGGLQALATTLGLTEVADLLGQTLAEEKAADLKLTEVNQEL